MRQVLLSIGVSPHHWVQHNLPWLAVLAIVFGFDRDDVAPGESRRDD
ncbi:hypothetical protein NIM87_10685 [Devosia sp. XJ19-1]|uniref:Uncharacterized protein n=1 Tax=Devosia ureilytica TaxID=2952754 RepID=A0A9Q4FT64_9HYPH|nr:hypothetical protein [Devosia ureilytica]MCP8883967.1 hypothetical protein [Devosia ureilytica]MCP8887575.1 hypothetical protein [Devosia ureilytica]